MGLHKVTIKVQLQITMMLQLTYLHKQLEHTKQRDQNILEGPSKIIMT